MLYYAMFVCLFFWLAFLLSLSILIFGGEKKLGKLTDTAIILPCRKYALTLQLQTAHILSAHATLDQKMRSIQDLKEQKNKLSRGYSYANSEC